MQGDFSRDTFDSAKNFSRVLMQQGRVQLDADWNEQAAIFLHYLRSLTTDLVGLHWGPATNLGFEISYAHQGNSHQLTVGKGHYYVNGILCNQVTEQVLADVQLTGRRNHLVYLDVWEELVSANQDDDIREKALGGVDTAARARIRWQVKTLASDDDLVIPDKASDLEENVWSMLLGRWQPQGKLTAQVKKPTQADQPCLLQPESRYRGTENQLYRIEIHTGGGIGTASFKWSRNNAAVITEIKGQDAELNLSNPVGFARNQWIEILSEQQASRCEAGVLAKITNLEGREAKVEIPESAELPNRQQGHWFARVWDMPKGATTVEAKSPIDIEDGLQIVFEDQGIYRSGDYWLIPARVATGNIEWPVDQEGKLQTCPPHGVIHHYAPLAILKFKTATEWEVVNCRYALKPTVELA